MSLCKIHNVRFYKPETRSIYNMALQKSNNRLAIARSDASVEIWDLNNTAFIERTIASTSENFSIEGLTWCENRLFSVGLHGLLVEYDTYKLCVKQKTSVTGEAAYCVDSNNKSQIAVGTEQGYLNIYNVENDDIMFEKFLDKQEGKIISLKFDCSGDYLVSGSIDAIRVWNVSTGHALHKMTVGRTEAKKPTIVWCLAVTNDFTVISGDSRGRLTFWDGKIGSQIESYQSHRADILSICLSEDQTSLYCAGADPCISNYVQVNVKGGTQKWVRSIQRRIHEHDVRALVLIDSKLYSGGIDGYLACSYHPPKTLIKSPPILQNSCTDLSTESRHILLRYPKHLEIWKLGQSQDVAEEHRGVVPLKSEPKKLLVLQKVVKSCDGEKEREGICTSCISNNGHWVLFSTNGGTRLVYLSYDNEKPTLKKVELDCSDSQCVQSIFSPDNTQIIVAPSSGGLRVYQIKDENVDEIQFILFNKTEIVDTITHLQVSNCNKYLVVGDADSNVVILVQKNDGWKSYCKLPKYSVGLTAMAIHPTLLNIVLVYADNKIVEYNIKKREFTQFSRYLQKNTPKQWSSRSYPIRNITFDTRNDNIIILHDDSNIIIVNKDKKVPEVGAKIPKIDSTHLSGDISYQHGFYSIKKYKHLVNLNWLSDDEMVAVEINPLNLLEQLPPAFAQNTFGRK